jgi:ribosomal protein S18 acetylase RimI-like enzyme
MPCHGPVHLRRAAVADAAGIAQVYVAGWTKAHAGLVPAEYAACMRARSREDFWRDELAVEAPDRKPWVALIDDRMVGFSSGGLSRDDDAHPGLGEVYQVYVDPECWHQGIGTALLRHVVRDLHDHGFERATLWTISANAGARSFVEKHGWHVDGAMRFEDCGGAQVEQVRYQHALR